MYIIHPTHLKYKYNAFHFTGSLHSIGKSFSVFSVTGFNKYWKNIVNRYFQGQKNTQIPAGMESPELKFVCKSNNCH